MRARAVARIAVAALVPALLAAGAAGSGAASASAYSMRAEADRAGINLGSAAQYWMPTNDPAYAALLDHQVNTITFENETKWLALRPSQDTYDFSYADTLADWAYAHGMHMRGHTLIWYARLPSWLTALTPTRDQAIDLMRDHIYTVVRHFRDKYPGLVTQWDVVNEVMDNDGNVRQSFWRKYIGDDYIDLAFRFARQAAGPDVQLYLNEYFDNAVMAGAEQAGDGDGSSVTTPGAVGSLSCDQVIKCDAVRTLVKGLLQRGVPIDGVGFQAHMADPDPSDYRALTAWVGNLGLHWALTEMDRPIHNVDDVAHAAQAQAMATAAQSCIDDPACDTIVTWGLADRYTWWKAASNNYYVDALPFGEDLSPKPAADAMYQVLAHAPTVPQVSATPTADPACVRLRVKLRTAHKRAARGHIRRRLRRLGC